MTRAFETRSTSLYLWSSILLILVHSLSLGRYIYNFIIRTAYELYKNKHMFTLTTLKYGTYNFLFNIIINLHLKIYSKFYEISRNTINANLARYIHLPTRYLHIWQVMGKYVVFKQLSVSRKSCNLAWNLSNYWNIMSRTATVLEIYATNHTNKNQLLRFVIHYSFLY